MAPNPIPLSPRRLAASGLRLQPSESAFREGSATIVMPTASAAFLNPVQEFNRDLSVLAIKAWSSGMDEGMRSKFEARRQRQRQAKAKGAEGAAAAAALVKGRKRGAGAVAGEEQMDGKKLKGENGEAHAESSKSAAAATATAAAESSSMLASGSSADASADTISNAADGASIDTDGLAKATAPTQHHTQEYRPFSFNILEALSATGLRSIRYAREIPLLREVIANDLSASAVEAMKRNVALNFPAERPIEEWIPETEGADEQSKVAPQKLGKKSGEMTEDELAALENGSNGAVQAAEASLPAADAPSSAQADVAAAHIHPDCKVRINEGDALDVMYTHRHPGKRFNVVDLDPYGSAAPFIDGAIQSVADNGLLCVTCTDLAVLASNSYPEKCFSLYGGSCTRSEFCHETALRLVLHTISTSAARYGRYIRPLLSLSIDFYVRLFIQVHTAPVQVKNLASNTGLVYVCNYCNNYHEQRLGRRSEAPSKKKGNMTIKYQNGTGPPSGIGQGSTCEECGSRYSISGPMWMEPIHDADFCGRLLSTLEESPERSKTAPRIRGMVSTAASELPDQPFYFQPAKISGLMHSESPPLITVLSALANAGYSISRSHCQPGSIKTNAPRSVVLELWRDWMEQGHPVRVESMAEGSPARKLVERKERAANTAAGGEAVGSGDDGDVASQSKPGPAATKPTKFDFTEHPEAKRLSVGVQGTKSVRYQQNPLPNWGPGSAASMAKAVGGGSA